MAIEVHQRYWARVERRFDEYVWLMESGQMTAEQRREFGRFYAHTVASMRKAAGPRKRVFPVGRGWYATPLPGRGHGYLQRGPDDCMQAALATLAQIPPQEVPDLGIDRQRLAGVESELIERRANEALHAWEDRLGLKIEVHVSPPWRAKRWIGVVESDVEFSGHCLLMSGMDVVFDPSQVLPSEEFAYGADDVTLGITIER